jgi:3'-phosphoadenosine 5'-phosphosulfate sulfotransferase
MKSDKKLIEQARASLRSVDGYLLELESLDGARNPKASSDAARKARGGVLVLSEELYELIGRFNRRHEKQVSR